MSILARPRWRVGQVLHPRHLLALEDALASEAALRAAVPGLPVYGVARLDWNGDDPANKVLNVKGLTAVFPDGTVVDVPGNASIRGPLDLSKPSVDVYLHVVDPPEDGKEEEQPLDEPTEDQIALRDHELELSASGHLPNSRDRLLLGRFILDIDGRYRLDETVIPPLLRIEASAVVASRVAKVRDQLAQLDRKLDGLAADALSQGRSRAPIQRVRIEARKLGALLDDLSGDKKQRRASIPLHPYAVFSALRAFSSELSMLDESKPPGKLPAYDHDYPAACFSQVFEAISEGIEWSPSTSPRVPFVLDGGRFVATLPDDALTASEVYVVVLKREETDVVPFERVRLASPRRLSLVREYAIQGVPIKRDPAPRANYGFGAGAEFYSLGTRAAAPGEEPREWDHVLRERALAFQASSQHEGQRFVLCWRRQ